jgi:hydrogenase/urease accessory protein HupE
MAAVVLALTARPVQAHLMETGFGGYYDGLAHLLLTPSDLLLVVALAVLAGQNGSRCSRWLLTLSFTLVGVLVALQVRAEVMGLSLLTGLLGLLHGIINGSAMNHGGGGSLALLGSVCGVAVIGAIIAGQTTVLQTSWQRIALRVMGSWIAASGLLMLGWLSRSAS